MEKLEKCTWKLSMEINKALIKPYNIKEDCKTCNGYNPKCLKYTVVKEECYGL